MRTPHLLSISSPVGVVAVTCAVAGLGAVLSAAPVHAGTPGIGPDRAAEIVTGTQVGPDRAADIVTGTQVGPDRAADIVTGTQAVRDALARDLGLHGTALDELLTASAAATALDARLDDQLGAAFAGSWFDHATAELSVAVTGPAAAELAGAAGAEATIVDRSLRELEAVTGDLAAIHERDPQAMSDVFAWGIDVRDNQVVVSVRTGRTAAVAPLLARYGEAVRIEETGHQPRLTQRPPFLDGGIEYVNQANGGICSTGFNLTNATGGRFFLTAGHCGVNGNLTSHAGTPIGPFVDSHFPGDDYALVQVTNNFWTQGPFVWVYPGVITIGAMTDAPVGTPICKSGRTTGLTCGTITAKNQTVTYSGGFVVTGLTRHNACVEPGDSGGSNFTTSGTFTAEGMTSGASLIAGLCLSRFGLPSVSWYFPIVDALD